MVTAKQTMLMKKILLFASAALLFVGCAKENITPTETPDNNSQKGDITLSFSASQTGFGTKAVIGETTGDGTIDNPITAAAGMRYFKDKYYLDGGKIYKCTRDDSNGQGTILHYLPSQLVGIYFEEA